MLGFVFTTLTTAPVPKAGLTTAEKVVGKWELVKSSNEIPEGNKCFVEMTKDGKMTITNIAGEQFTVYKGTYTVKDQAIDYTVMIGENAKTEILTIRTIKDDELVVTDPDDVKEEFKRVKEIPTPPKK